MRQTAFALILGSSLAVSLPAADPQLLNMVMPEAKVIAGINVDSARNSPFGTFLLRQASGTMGELQKFVDATGFNPQTDLNEILMATLGSAATPTDGAGLATGAPVAASPDLHGLILARGNFNIEKIAELAKTDGKQKVQKYNGATLVLDPKNMHASAMAFIGTNIAVVGDLASVKAAVDRRSFPSSVNPELTNKVNSLSNSQDMWAVSIAPLSSLNAGPATDPTLQGALAGDLFKKITETSGGIKFGQQIQLSTEMVAMDEKNAAALGDVVRFLVGMATMNSGSTKGGPSAMVSLLQSLTVKTDGKVVNVTVSAPEDQIEDLFNSMQPSGKKVGATI
jgi:hypothetical protein